MQITAEEKVEKLVCAQQDPQRSSWCEGRGESADLVACGASDRVVVCLVQYWLGTFNDECQ